MFFVSRHIFDRTGQLERKTLEKSPKSTLHGVPKIDPRATKIALLEVRIHRKRFANANLLVQLVLGSKKVALERALGGS